MVLVKAVIIKALKRNAYGFRNFKRLKNKILHIFSQNKNL